MNRLKELRLKSGINQKELCKLIGLEYQNYNKYELNKNEPNIETLIKIADFYGVSLDYLCEHQYNNQIGYVPDERRDILHKVLSLDDKQLEKVDGYISALLDN